MAKVYISLGSNIGNRLKNIKEAIKQIGDTEGIKIIRLSSVYETEPVGYKNQNYFMNIVLEIETEIAPFDLMEKFLEIENIMGRRRMKKWGPRNIDIDMLLYNGVIIESQLLTLPHPRMGERAFIMTPLKELLKEEFDAVIKKHDLNINLGTEKIDLLYNNICEVEEDG